MQWVVPTHVAEITQDYVKKNMPEGTTSIQFLTGVRIGNFAFVGCTGLTQVKIAAGVYINATAFKDCANLCFIIAPEGFPRYSFPANAVVVTYAEYEEMNRCFSQYGLQHLKSFQDKITIMCLCHNGNDIAQADLQVLSHLPVSTVLNVIGAYSAISHNVEQSKQLLAWVMGADFVRVCGDKEVSEMLTAARGGRLAINWHMFESSRLHAAVSKFRQHFSKPLPHPMLLVQRSLVRFCIHR